MRHTRSRFLSIFILSALAVAFLAGLRTTAPDMQHTADDYFDANGLMDVHVLSTLGITDDDISFLESQDGIQTAEGAYTVDALWHGEENDLILKVLSLSDKGINAPKLIEGRLPRNSRECLVEPSFLNASGLALGDILALDTGDGDFEGALPAGTYTIVGTVISPLYLSMERGSSSLGTGRVSAFVLLPLAAFDMDAYTDAYLTGEGLSRLMCYSDAYEDAAQALIDRLEPLGDDRAALRYDEVMAEANEKLADAEQELSDAEIEVEQELSDAWQKLLDARAEIDKGWRDYRREIADAKQKIADGEVELSDALAELNDGEAEYADGLVEWQDGRRELLDGEDEYNDNLNLLQRGEEQYQSGLAEYTDGLEEVRKGYAALADAKRELDSAAAQLSAGSAQLAQGQAQYNAGKQQLDQAQGQFDTLLGGASQAAGGVGGDAILSGGINDAQAGSIADNILKPALDDVNNKLGQMEAGGITSGDAYDALKQQQSGLQKTIGAAQIPGYGSGAIAGYFGGQKQALDSNRTKLDSALAQLNAGAAELAAGQAQYADGKRQYNEAKKELDDAYADLESAGATLSDTRDELDDGWAKLSDGRRELDDAWLELEDGRIELEDGRRELDDGWAEYYDGVAELDDAKAELPREMAKAERKLNDAEQEYADGLVEYEDGKREAEQKLSDARNDLAKARRDVADIEDCEWYVLGRDTNMGYISYQQDADRMSNLANVFPLIFFLVAALVCLTTMTRMVEDQRIQIGGLKALGYGKGAIAFKYVGYGFAASFLGGAVGLAIGVTFFPLFIFNAWATLYTVGSLELRFFPAISFGALAAAVACVTGTALASAYAAVAAVPAQLMRPKAPPVGKRVFLEYVKPLWKRLTFAQKVACRNLFRYKKRFIMTVAGIGGCTALIITGFGLRDSIMATQDGQYNDISLYSSEVSLAKDMTAQERADLDALLSRDGLVGDWLYTYRESLSVESPTRSINAALTAPEEPARLTDFITLRHRADGAPVTLPDQGVVLTEKLSELLGVSVGDTVVLDGDRRVTATVDDITENYVMHYVYLSPAAYEQLYGKTPVPNLLLAAYTDNSEETADTVSTALIARSCVTSISLIRNVRDTFAKGLAAVNYAVVIITASAAALAFVVLYNLTNINITERLRELATLKVLGFYDGELSAYIYRENAVLTVFGILAGLVMGKFLHQWLVLTVEVEMAMFGRSAAPMSYVYAVGLTFLFSVLVNLAARKRLKKIDMVESLKTVE